MTLAGKQCLYFLILLAYLGHGIEGACPTGCLSGTNCDAEADGGCPQCDPAYYGRQCQYRIECKYTSQGKEYLGQQNYTNGGILCQRWSSQTPQAHPYTSYEGNYCRNPDNSQGPWCYTTNPSTRWQYCTVPTCNVQCKAPTLPAGAEILNPSGIGVGFVDGYILTIECAGGTVTTSTCKSQTWSAITCPAVHCTLNPKDISNTNIANSTVSYGEQLPFTCSQGYETNNTSPLECLRNGTFSGTKPLCSVVECPTPSEQANSRIVDKKDKYTYLETVLIECKEGYETLNAKTLTCQANKQWDVPSPACTIIKCPALELKPNSSIDTIQNGFVYNSSVYITCDNGYETTDATTLVCQSNKAWNLEPPVCNPVRCPNLILNAYSTIVAPQKEYVFSNTISVECDTGYETSDNTVLTCQSDGSWNNVPPVCSIVECPIPSENENSRIVNTKSKYTYLEMVLIECNEGYDTTDAKILNCQANKLWDASSPTCTVIKCPALNLEPNSIIDTKPNEYLYNTSVHITCDNGYETADPTTLICQSNKAWDQEPPRCNPVRCPNLILNAYSTIVGPQKEYIFGNTIYIECDMGYETSDNTLLTCESDGSWNVAPPVCSSIQCPTPKIKNNSHISNPNTEYNYNFVLHIQCDEGFELTNSYNDLTCQYNKSWDLDAPTCEVIKCPGLKLSPNSTIDIKQSEYVYNTSVHITCVDGYETTNLTTLRCHSNKAWDHEPPVCNPIRCSTPILNAFSGIVVPQDEYLFGDAIYISCDIGYETSDDDLLTCQSNKTWNFAPPVCSSIRCMAPNLKVNSHISNQNTPYHYNSVLHIVCDEGFELTTSNNYLTCQDNKDWSFDTPTCEVIKCPAILLKPNSTIDVKQSEYVYNTSVHITCEIGYETTDQTTLTCQSNKAWDQKPPVCNPVRCSTPNLRAHSTITSREEYIFGNAISVECDEGYETQDITLLTCQANKTWDIVPPVCSSIKCPSPILMNNSYIDNAQSEYIFNSVIHIKCVEGYELLSSNSYLTCLYNKSWDFDIPTCEAISCFTPELGPNSKLLNPSLNKYIQNDSVQIMCKDGYKMANVNGYTCLLNNHWSAPFPNCNPIKCLKPKLKPNSTIQNPQPEYVFNTTIQIICAVGYETSDPTLISCQSDMQWNYDAPECKILRCHPPNLQPNSHILDSNADYEYKKTLQIECDYGFETNDSTRLTCNENKQWDINPPTCTAVKCITPKLEPNSEIVNKQSEYEYNTTMNIKCKNGYDTKNATEIICKADRQWNAQPPTCSEIKCKAPTLNQHGILSNKTDVFNYNETIVIQCESGYETMNQTVLACVGIDTWNFAIPDCHAITCPVSNLKQGNKIVSTLEKYEFNQTIQIVCEDGYELIPPVSSTCLATKQWSVEFPNCTGIRCPFPLEKENSFISNKQKDYLFNTSVIFECKEGFLTKNQTLLTCQPNGKWDYDSPDCIPVTCLASMLDNNYKFVDPKPEYNYNETVQIECGDGYQAGNYAYLNCSNDSWVGDLPECVGLNCPIPVPKNKSSIVNMQDQYQYPSSLYITCDEGFGTRDVSVLVCQTNLTWDVEPPNCEAISCLAPTAKPHSEIVNKTDVYMYNESVIVSCIEGYEMNTTTMPFCQEINTWNMDLPECMPVRCVLPELKPHNKIIDSQKYYILNSSVNFGCEAGYFTTNKTKLTCQSDKKWDEELPTCYRVTCTNPKLQSYSKVLNMNETYTYGSTIEIVCDEGYETDNNFLTCQDKDMWDKNVPECKPVLCPIPLLNGNIILDPQLQYEFKSIIQVKCGTGFEASGTKQLTCQSNKMWNDSFPLCKPVRCSSPSQKKLIHSSIKLSHDICGYKNADGTVDYVYNTSIEIECHAGYSTKGITTLVCQHDKTWNLDPPVCTLITCDIPILKPNSSIINKQDRYVPTNIMEIRCHDGFETRDNTALQCNENGAWNIPPPQCQEMACGVPLLKAGSRIAAPQNQYMFNTAIEVECEEGYEPLTKGSLTCQSDKQWSSEPPACALSSTKKVEWVAYGVAGILLAEIAIFAFIYGIKKAFTIRKKYKVQKKPKKLKSDKHVLSLNYDEENEGNDNITLDAQADDMKSGHHNDLL